LSGELRAEPDPEAACRKLLAQANEAGGRDNITLLIVRFDPADADSGSG
jgi:serine/threonine protein phosphatase PrpC